MDLRIASKDADAQAMRQRLFNDLARQRTLAHTAAACQRDQRVLALAALDRVNDVVNALAVRNHTEEPCQGVAVAAMKRWSRSFKHVPASAVAGGKRRCPVTVCRGRRRGPHPLRAVWARRRRG